MKFFLTKVLIAMNFLTLLFGNGAQALSRVVTKVEGKLVVEIKSPGGLTATEKETLPGDFVKGITQRIAENGVEMTQMGETVWSVSGDISRLPGQGDYLLTVRLLKVRGMTQELVRQWIGTASANLYLSHYRGRALINEEGLVGEISKRISDILIAYDPTADLRCLRELKTLTNSVVDGGKYAPFLKANWTVMPGNTSTVQELIVSSTKPGNVWFIGKKKDEANLLSEKGISLGAGKPVRLLLAPGWSDGWVVMRADTKTDKIVRDKRGPQGDIYVSILEMGPGYGATERGILNLLDRISRDAKGLWLVRYVTPKSATVP